MSELDKIECAVIGAGVVGLAVARRLAAEGRDVVVLEAEDAIGTGISSRNSEVIHAGIYYPKDSLKTKLCVAGKKMLVLKVMDGGPNRGETVLTLLEGKERVWHFGELELWRETR